MGAFGSPGVLFMTLPIESNDFWKDRLENARTRDTIHTSIYDVDYSRWQHIQEIHAGVLLRIFERYPHATVLDAGCGYGALIDILPASIDYTGVDLSPDLIAEARKRYSCRFMEGNLRTLPFVDQHFDLAICRSVDGMVKENIGIDAWLEMEKELLRTARHLALLNYSEPGMYTVIDAADYASRTFAKKRKKR